MLLPTQRHHAGTCAKRSPRPAVCASVRCTVAHAQSREQARGMQECSPACDRNRHPILDVLRHWLPADVEGGVLEVASGTGQHVAHFAPAFPRLKWQPTDRVPDSFPSIAAWTAGLPNVCLPPLILDVRDDGEWPLPGGMQPLAIYAANVTHISPWEVTQGLMSGASRHLQPGGLLVLYGPFNVGGKHTSEGNAAFDVSLRARDPAWGLRDVEAVQQEADKWGLTAECAPIAMPANNLTLVFRRRKQL